jgi:hypothetical protein
MGHNVLLFTGCRSGPLKRPNRRHAPGHAEYLAQISCDRSKTSAVLSR